MRALALTVCVAAIVGCSTTRVDLAYRGSDTPSRRSGVGPVVALGKVQDQREKGPLELGVVRGGYGNVLKRIVAVKPVAEMTEEAMRAAFAERGLLAGEGRSRVRLDVTVRKLDCNYFQNREAHAHLEVDAVEAGTGTRLWSESYEEDIVEGGLGAGVFADVEHLRKMLESALVSAVDDVVGDTERRLASGPPPSGNAAVVIGGPCAAVDGAPPQIGAVWETYRGCQSVKYRLVGEEASDDGSVSVFSGDGDDSFVVRVIDGEVVRWETKRDRN